MTEELLKQFDEFAERKQLEYMSLRQPALAAHMKYIQMTLHSMTKNIEKGDQQEWNRKQAQGRASYTA